MAVSSFRPLALSAVIFAHKNPGRRMVLRLGDRVLVLAEVAVGEVERAKGLAGREQVYDGEGMLFVMPSAGHLAFWMHDTSVPLSIAFIAEDGRILEIKDMEPFSEERVYSSSPVRMALEVPQGWFERRGVRVGTVVSVAS